MNFEERLRERINAASFKSTEKDILKLVLGECQAVPVAEMGKMTDEKGNGIIKKLIKSNEETLGYLSKDDDRRSKLEEENEILAAFLPSYWSAEKIQAEFLNHESPLCESITNAKSDGQATGIAMKHLQSINAPVEGQTVKEVVAALGAS